MPLNQERGSKMKRLICILLVALAAFYLTACQETPDEVVVVQKDTERLVEQIRENSPEESPAEAQTGLREALGAPQRYTARFDYSENLTMTADAEVVLPNAPAIPTVRVKPMDFSQNMVNRMYEYLVGDTVMYEAQPLRTKSQIEEDILEWQRTLADDNAAAESKAQAEERIGYLREAYKTAPDAVEYVKGGSEIKTLTEYDIVTGKEIYSYQGVSVVEDPEPAEEGASNRGKRFEVRQNNTGSEIIKTENVGGFSVFDTASRGARFTYSDYALWRESIGRQDYLSLAMGNITQEEWENASYQFNDFSPASAATMVQDFLSHIGADDMVVGQIQMDYEVSEEYNEIISNGNPYDDETLVNDFKDGKLASDIYGVTYEVYCLRQVGGVSVASDEYSSYLGEDAYGAQWYYEELRIGVCEDGIYSVQWRSPHEITETITDDTAMLPFADVEKIIGQMFRVKYEPYPGSTSISEYEIDRLELSLRRVMEQDNVENGLLIPVWDVYGFHWYSEPDIDLPKVRFTGKQSLLTINAIDGSIIDLSKGY